MEQQTYMNEMAGVDQCEAKIVVISKGAPNVASAEHIKDEIQGVRGQAQEDQPLV